MMWAVGGRALTPTGPRRRHLYPRAVPARYILFVWNIPRRKKRQEGFISIVGYLLEVFLLFLLDLVRRGQLCP